MCARDKTQTRSKVFSPELHHELGDVQVVEAVFADGRCRQRTAEEEVGEEPLRKDSRCLTKAF